MSFLKGLLSKNGDQLAKNAIENYNSGKDEFRVIDDLEKVISIGVKRFPLDTVYVHLGAAYSDVSMNDKAIEAYQQALEINPKNHMALSNMALILKSIGETERSLELLYKAIEAYPRYSTGYHNLGCYYYDIGLYHKAIGYLRTALKINPLLIVSYASIARCYARLGRIKEARKYVGEARWREYEHWSYLKKYVEQVIKDLPVMNIEEKSLLSLADALTHSDLDLLMEMQQAFRDPEAFYEAHEERVDALQLTSFEIINVLPLHLLLNKLRQNNHLIEVLDECDTDELLKRLSTLLLNKYGIEDAGLAEFEEEAPSYLTLDFLSSIAHKLSIEKGIELLAIQYYDDEFILTLLDSPSWRKLNYPYRHAHNGIGSVKSLSDI